MNFELVKEVSESKLEKLDFNDDFLGEEIWVDSEGDKWISGDNKTDCIWNDSTAYLLSFITDIEKIEVIECKYYCDEFGNSYKKYDDTCVEESRIGFKYDAYDFSGNKANFYRGTKTNNKILFDGDEEQMYLYKPKE